MRMMKEAVVACAIAGLIACGGSNGENGSGNTDYAMGTDGHFVGSSTLSVDGQTATASGDVHVAYLAKNLVRIHDVCADASGPSASVGPGGSLSIEPGHCPPGTVGTCSSVTLAVSSGSGSLTTGNMTLHLVGTFAGCGESYPFTLDFSGTRSSSLLSQPTAAEAISSVVSTKFQTR